MKKEQFSDLMSNIDDALIVNAKEKPKSRKKPMWVKTVSIAACFCLVLSAFIVIPTMMNKSGGSIISEYNSGGILVDSISHTPLPGECIFSHKVEEARKAYAGKDVKFLLAFDVFNGIETGVSDDELKAEYQRLSNLGFKLYYVEDHWTYYGKGEKKYIPIVVGLFTEEQLADFDVNEKYGYSFYFVTNGDGSAIDIDEENTVTNFDSIAC